MVIINFKILFMLQGFLHKHLLSMVFGIPNCLYSKQKRACPIIFHPVRQALVNLNQRIREKQSTPYGLNRLPETHALTHEIYQTSPNQQERQKNDLLYVCRKSNAQIYEFIKYVQPSDLFVDCFFYHRFNRVASIGVHLECNCCPDTAWSW